jgi:hypothetical protein
MRTKITNKWAGMQAGITGDPENRPDSDFYQTPQIAVQKLLEAETFQHLVWEPACGKGAIVDVLEDAGHNVMASDLFEYPDIDATFGVDFLTQLGTVTRTDIVTNPPFRLALEFAVKGLSLLKGTRGKLALLNRLAWLESAKRRPFFESSPLKSVWVFSNRLPMMHRPDWEGTKIATGTVAYAWFVWQDGYRGKPRVGWI